MEGLLWFVISSAQERSGKLEMKFKLGIPLGNYVKPRKTTVRLDNTGDLH